MAKKESPQKKIALEHRQAGYNIVADHPVFKYLARGGSWRDEYKGGLIPASTTDADFWARVSAAGTISHHPTRIAPPEQWAWVFAHCLLHVGMGHSDPQVTGVLQRDTYHDAACCAVVNRLLRTIKLGQPPFILSEIELTGDETTLAKHWRETGPSASIPMGMGTAGSQSDMGSQPYSKKVTTGAKERLARGLSDAVTSAVDRAGGLVESEAERRKHPWNMAMSWFISSYPLLGGIAAGFKIVAEAEVCRRYDISIAAVDDRIGEIYINPQAGLTQAEWQFVLAHEMLHAGLRHGPRIQGRDAYLWNIAADYVVNGWLVELGIGDLPDGVLYDMALKDLSVEAVYERITGDIRLYRKLATLRGKGLGDVLGESLPLPREHFGAVDLEEFYRRALTTGLAFHQSGNRGYVPAGLVEEIRVLDQPPITWDVALARWFDDFVRSPEPIRTYARLSRRQASTPDIVRPGRYFPETDEHRCTFGVVLDTSGSMDRQILGKALGAITSYAMARDVPAARVIFCDAAPYDAGYLPVEEIAGRVRIRGRGGTVLQPGIDFLERTPDFPTHGPILIITDAECDTLRVRRNHAYLIPAGAALPFHAMGPVFRVT